MKVIKADEFQYVITSDNKIVSLFRKPNLACVESNLNKGSIFSYNLRYLSLLCLVSLRSSFTLANCSNRSLS